MKLFLLTLFLFFLNYVSSQDLVINEFMSSNSSVISDDEGDFVDWIEIYNTTNNTVNLYDYYLSDDSTELTKWKFPSVSMVLYNLKIRRDFQIWCFM